ncbi:MAG: hypothetical protein K2Z81_16610, partial [Cyanobacteria bacterium]|nr:hypothetical protein [Cyanobacteriota bacterium]
RMFNEAKNFKHLASATADSVWPEGYVSLPNCQFHSYPELATHLFDPTLADRYHTLESQISSVQSV